MVIIHVFPIKFFRDEPDCWPKPTLLRPSARELISKLPEEVPVEEWEARKEGNFYSSVTTLFPSYPVSSSYSFQVYYQLYFRIVRRGGSGHLPEGGPGHPY